MLAPKDVNRLAEHFGLTTEAFLEQYAEECNGKYQLTTGQDAYCIFFREGCTVHDAKPDICRAWPFFRGNIEDPSSLDMAKEYCLGIDPRVPHEVFAAAGRAFLREAGLLQDDPGKAARALCLDPEKS